LFAYTTLFRSSFTGRRSGRNLDRVLVRGERHVGCETRRGGVQADLLRLFERQRLELRGAAFNVDLGNVADDDAFQRDIVGDAAIRIRLLHDADSATAGTRVDDRQP